MLFGFWYRALASDRLGPGCKTKVSFPDAAVLVGRDRAGRPFALRDTCPHRGMPLSYGWFDGDSVQCRYHGWTFDVHTGQCRRIPSLLPSQESSVAKIYAGHMSCEERDGFVWVFLPEGKGKGCGPTVEGPALAPPTMPIFSKKHRFVQLSSEVPTSADHGLTSLLDPVHGPFVHRRWWWIVRVLFGIADDGDSLVEIVFSVAFGGRYLVRDTETGPICVRSAEVAPPRPIGCPDDAPTAFHWRGSSGLAAIGGVSCGARELTWVLPLDAD